MVAPLSVSNSSIRVANAALALLGVREIADFNESSIAARTMNQMYEDVVEDALCLYPWRFATRRIQAQRSVTTPPAPWLGLYEIPSALLHPRTVYSSLSDESILFDVFERNVAVMIDENSTETVDVEGAVMVSAQYWPGHFRRSFIQYLAGAVAMPITQDDKLAQIWSQRGQEGLRLASSRDGQNRTQRKLDTSTFIRARRGGYR